MNAEEIKTKAAELAELFSAVAKGKILQNLLMYESFKEWRNTTEFPYMYSDLSFWRVKPEPQDCQSQENRPATCVQHPSVLR